MRIQRILISLTLACTLSAAMAVPARRGVFTVTQPDGTELAVMLVGDEHSHYLITADDRRLVTEGDDGVYYYSHVCSDGMELSTGVPAVPAGRVGAIERAVMQSIDEVDVRGVRDARLSARQAAASRAIDQTGMGLFTGDFPRKGNIKGLVILVEYADVKFNIADPHDYFSAMLNQEGFSRYGGTGSARDYFIQNSNSQFVPEFDLYGPYTLPNNMSYYGKNDYTGNDTNPHMMVVHACKGLNDEINFADYDMDNDGYVDNVFIFYAGQGEASGGSKNSVWPHSWNITYGGQNVVLDGKKIDRYACSNEWETYGGTGRPDGIGTFVHEFSHVMGLPDLYNTGDSDVVGTPGEWSVMDYGPYNNDGCTPPCYSTFERNAMGWIEPMVIDDGASVTLGNLADTNEACLIPTTSPTEFFLLENRQQQGWDKYIPGHGLLIWHVDFNQNVWDQNEVNNNQRHMYVEIEKANNNSTAEYGWSWPGTSGKTEFTNQTSPSMSTWNGTPINMPVTNIAEKNKVASFDVAGGGALLDQPVLAYTTTGTNAPGFTVTWPAVEGATDYRVSVARQTTDASQTDVCDGNRNSLPAGWSKVGAIDQYISAGNYGESAPSLKFAASGQALLSREYDGVVTGLEFWYKGNTTSGATRMDVYGLIDGDWQLIYTLDPTDNKAGTVRLTDLPAGIHQIKFLFSKDKGNVGIDDIKITYGAVNMVPYPGHESVLTGGATAYTVNVPQAHASDVFTVKVKATDGSKFSRESAIYIDLSKAVEAGIDSVTADADASAEYYSLQGIRVTNPAAGQVYIERRGANTRKIIF